MIRDLLSGNRSYSTPFLITIGLLYLLVISGWRVSDALPLRSGRSVGLAGSGALVMWGVQADGWNPALLGLKASPKFSLIIPSVGLTVGNNAFSPQFITDHFQEGDTLTEADKTEILNQMGRDKLTLRFGLGIPVLGFSAGNLAIAVQASNGLRFSLPRDLFELALTGPRRDVVYDFSTLDLDIASYTTLGISYAENLSGLLPFASGEMSVGGTVRYIYGLGFTQLDRKTATLQVTQDAIHAEGNTRLLTGTKGGTGYGLDLGWVWAVKKNVLVGLTLGNLIGSITWKDVEAREAIFSRNSGLHPDSLANSDYYKHFLTQEDTTYTISSHRTPLSRYLLLSGLLIKGHKGFVGATLYQGFNTTPFQNTTPRLSIGGEWRPIVSFPLRAGFSVGGLEGVELAGGFGIHLVGYQINLGASWQGGVLTKSKGFSIALTQVITPLPKWEREKSR
ncbi:MAG: DUF5723 family protein [bacterium]